MFDTNVYINNSARKIDLNTYQISAHVPYYRSIPLSMINDIRLEINGNEIERDSIRISPDNRNWFSLDEAKTVIFHKWEYSVPLKINFKSENELKQDELLKVIIIVRTAYIPVPIHGELQMKVNFEQ